MTSAPSRGRASRVSNATGLLRYGIAVAIQPRLRNGPRMTVGKRFVANLGPAGRVLRDAGVVFAADSSLTVEGVLRIAGPSYFGPGTSITCFEAVTIGADFRCGESVSFHDENHVFEPLQDREARKHHFTTGPITVGDRVWVGARSVILPGVTIGDDAVLAAGSVVTRDIPAGHLAGGVPARVIRPLEP